MNQKIRTAILFLIPLVLVVIAIVFAPSTTAKVLTAWGYVIGAFQGAVGLSLLASRKSDQ